ncbi:MAG: lipid asymmetry maintenance ABC transporter permease subunit MlaE [Methylacidiphilales bacterium]|nr:lipid asymmetry maintenance ABC transporter permease subunit MlaE [Candidatus Methylacidiphilales bacterium]
MKLFNTIITTIGTRVLLLVPILVSVVTIPRRYKLLVKQLYVIGVLSAIIIIVSGLFVGMVLALQGYNTLVKFNSKEAVGVLVLLSLTREIGPVISALLFAGRSGSAITAEVALMKATEQISSIEIIGVNPNEIVYGPRFFASIISLPLLTSLFITAGLWGGYFVSCVILNLDSGVFWTTVKNGFDFQGDFMNGIIKSFIFAIACAWIALAQGIDSDPTPEGMSKSTTNTVVYSSLSILGLNYLLSSIMFSNSTL